MLPSASEQVAHDVAHQLATTGHVDDFTYDAASSLLGDVGVVELVTICGFYAFVSFVLNTFEVPPPDGAQPVFATTTSAAGALSSLDDAARDG